MAEDTRTTLPTDAAGAREDVICLDHLLANTGYDSALMAELLTMFCHESPGMVANVRRALELHDSAALERAAHRLRGSLTVFGARAATAVALDVEVMGRNRVLNQAPARVDDLVREVRRVQAAVRSHAILEAS